MWRRYLIGNLVFLVRILISRYTHKDPYKQVKEAHLSQ